MANPFILPLSINGDTFVELKDDFDSVLFSTLANMEQKDTDTAEITLKLSVNLMRANKIEKESLEESVESLLIPSFKHSVQSVLQIKDKKTGGLEGDYKLVYVNGAYVMKPINDDQISFFDESLTEQG